MPSKLSQEILKEIKDNQLFKKHQRVLIGVSGGADSVALLRLLDELKHHWGLTLTVAHFDHNLRSTSKKDKQFVDKLAAQFNITCVHGSWPKSKQSKKGSLEQNARVFRYQFFKKALKKTNADCLALAHTRDDQAETLLMRFLKGSGLMGYQGIRCERMIDGMRVVRPLLNTRKKEILEFLKQIGQKYCEDPSNKDISLTRNLIRKDILPDLAKKLNPQLTETLARSANIMHADYVYLEKQGARKLKNCAQLNDKSVMINLEKFKASDPSLQRMMLRLSYQHLSGSTRALTFRHIQEMEDLVQNRPGGSVVHLTKNIDISTYSNTIKMACRKKA